MGNIARRSKYALKKNLGFTDIKDATLSAVEVLSRSQIGARLMNYCTVTIDHLERISLYSH